MKYSIENRKELDIRRSLVQVCASQDAQIRFSFVIVFSILVCVACRNDLRSRNFPVFYACLCFTMSPLCFLQFSQFSCAHRMMFRITLKLSLSIIGIICERTYIFLAYSITHNSLFTSMLGSVD